MPWYDWFASFYDLAVERAYRPYRARIIDSLALEPGAVVMDLCCGTGQNFPFLARALSGEGAVLGVDSSAGMLRRAERRIEREGYANVHLLERDATLLTAEDVERALGRDAALDGVLVTLGLSTLPAWEEVLDHTWDLLRPGGRFVAFDVYARRWVPQTSWVSLIARADLGRRSWEHLAHKSDRTTVEWLEGSPHLHGGNLFLACAVK
jgi:demethylmenaquinone methyltransferase/2-methoxy-6-polyprenyl-1,4-benzoquinol methylase